MNKMQHKLKWQTPNWLRVLCLTLLVSSIGYGVKAQTTIATTLANNNGSSVVIGNLFNSNSYDIIVSEIRAAAGSTGSQTAQLWTKVVTGPNMGAPGAVSTANGWVLQASQTVTTTANTTATGSACDVILSGMNVNLTANTYYLFCVSLSTSIRYSTVGTQTCTFSGGGVDLTYCASNGYGGTLASPVNNPRGLVGAITFSPAVACTGTPTPGNTLATATAVCPGQSITLSLQNSQGTGTTYQWNDASGAITGATNASYTTTPTGPNTFYCDVTCSNSGLSASSTPISTTMSGFLTCYCIPTTTNGCTAGDHITNVTFTSGGNPINNTTGACLTASYSDYTSTIATAQVTQGDFVPVSVSVNNGGTEYAGAWIDYNQSGTFDASEFITLTDADGVAPWIYTATASIPVTATLGLTRMRFRSSYAAVVAANSACATYSYGETEDYYVNISVTTACTGVPAPGNTIASATTVCPGTNVNFSLQNFTPGTGVSYQWNNNAGAIAGATNAFYSQAITAADDFYCDVTCGTSTTSSGLVSISLNSFMDCYCASASTIAADEEIYNVTVNGVSTPVAYSYTNGCTTAAPGPGSVLSNYSNFKSLGSLFTLMEGAPAPFEVHENECDGTPYYANGIGIWIDYNQNGSFNDPGEAVYIEGVTSAATGLSPAGDKVISGMITPPFGATLGQTVMRVISAEGFSGTSLTPCITYGYGETEDYIVTITPNTLCAGQPTPGNTIASTTTACLGSTVNLSLQNLTTGGGVSYQWNSLASGAIAGATNSTYAIVGFTAANASDYWCDVTCSGSGLTGSSTPVTITQNSYLNCYCPASSSFGSFAGIMNNVSFNTISNASGFPAVAPYYTNYPYSGTTTTAVTIGNTYPLAVTVGQYTQAAVWIDWDQNGIFDASEYTYLGTQTAATPATYTQVITVPATAAVGTTRMRIRGEYYGYVLGATNACGNTTYGETEDYTIDVVLPFACSGYPAPGNTLASATSVCPGAVVNFTIANTNNGTGASYQWNNNAGPIAGATNSYYSQAITAADDFYCDVTCANSGLTTASSLISIALNNFYSCYCTSMPTNTADEELYQVTVNGGSTDPLYANANGCTTVAPGAGSILSRYSNFTTLAPITSVAQAQTVTFEVRENECDGGTLYANGIGIWIDYNHNGLFTDPGEAVYIQPTTSAATGASPGGDKVITGTFTVPLGALTGSTGMRVITAEGYSGATLTPCLAYGYGETEDYLIDITAAPSCAGTPTPGATVSTQNPACPNTAVTLSMSTPPTTLGNTYQWFDGAGAIAGATNATYTIPSFTTADTYYCEVTCTTSGLSASSTSLAVGLSGFINCYCIPAPTALSCIYDWIGNVTIGTINNTSGCTAPFIAYPNTITTDINLGVATPISLSTVGYSGYFDVFVDLNQDGIYQISERLLTDFLVGPTGSSAGSYTGTTNLTIPLTATAGVTKMRVRYDYFYTAYNGTGAQDPCAGLYEGETEDYFVNLVIPNNCSGTPTPGATLASAASVCAGATVNFSLTTPPTELGISFQWYEGATAISGATNATYSSVISVATTVYCAVSCSFSGLTGNSTPVSIALNAASACYCTPVTSCTFPDIITNVTFAGINRTSTCDNASGGYSNWNTAPNIGAVTAGSSYPLSVSTGGDIEGVAVWIDYNQSGTFDATELVANGLAGTNPATYASTITVPATALSGSTRMRVRCVYNTDPSVAIGPCANTTYGETEDYLINVTPVVSNTVLNLKMYIQGYWDGTSAMLPVLANQFEPTTAGACDSIDVELRDEITYAMVQTVRTVLQTDGTATCTYPPVSGNYYIAVKHRNAIQTWSANPVALGPTPTTYDFSTSDAQAYGNNQIEVSTGIWAFFSGDVVIDENMDLLDISTIETDISAFGSGYLSTDINGDGNVDLLDSPPVETNISNFIFSNHP